MYFNNTNLMLCPPKEELLHHVTFQDTPGLMCFLQDFPRQKFLSGLSRTRGNPEDSYLNKTLQSLMLILLQIILLDKLQAVIKFFTLLFFANVSLDN